MNKLLEVKDLKVYYTVKENKGIHTLKKQLKAVDGVSFDIYEGETFGIVGESGCGKTTTGKAIVGLLKPTDGKVLFEGEDVHRKMERAARYRVSANIQLIFQDPYSSLDPRFTVGRIIGEPLVVHRACSHAERKEKVLSLMRDVGLLEAQYSKFPHEFSGGQRQRIGVARALALNPKLIVCDEPVSALDVSIQAQILNLLEDLQEKYNLTYIFISHNLSVVKHLCDRIAVMYLGNIVELSATEELFDQPLHPYTQALLSAVPTPDPDRARAPVPLEGDVPSPIDPPSGCCFRTRCPHASERCAREKPALRDAGNGHMVACHEVR